MNLVTLALVAAGSTAALTFCLVYFTPRVGLVDTPNARSSHTAATPRGGGLAIVIVCAFGLRMSADFTLAEQWALIPPLLAVAAIGLADDVRGVGAPVRFVVHLLSALWLVFGLVELPNIDLPWIGAAPYLVAGVIVVGITWFINAFNFMDGIDGIAGSQSLFVGVGLIACLFPEFSSPIAQAGAIVAGASAGFLVFNWSPARIFMGDVGSGAIGFLLSALVVVAWARGDLSLWGPATLLTLFVADATATLVRRVLLGQQWYSAHRSHVYQRLARKANSHAKATAVYAAINVLVVAPLALLASASSSSMGFLIWIAALGGGCAVAYFAGGGLDGR